MSWGTAPWGGFDWGKDDYFESYLSSLSRTPITFIIITLDFCGRTFGTSPCLATGTPCYNTFSTCKYKTTYLKQSKDYRFSSNDAPLPFKTGERPYLEALNYLPCEIKDKDNLTISARVSIKFYDEPDNDIGIDPYVSQRSSIQGTFWKKLLARNSNYKGRTVKIYEGFLGLEECQFKQRFVGIVDNITLEKGSIKIEVKDLLKKLSDLDIPKKLEIKLISDITADTTTLTLSTINELDSPAGYIRIKDEIIYYSGINTPANQLTGCTRGYFSTTAAEHKANDKVQKIKYYAPANPFDILKEMLTVDAGIDTTYIDTTSFDYWRDYPGGEVNFSAIIEEPTKLETLFYEIVNLIDCKVWVAENLKITIARNMPNVPGRQYLFVSDQGNIIDDSSSVDVNEKSRVSRVLIYWNKTILEKIDDINSYSRIEVALDADSESANDYNEVIEKKIYCRWLSNRYINEDLLRIFIKNFAMRQVFRNRNASPIISFAVELKDSNLKTGDFIRLNTDELLNIDGSEQDNVKYQIIRREAKENKVELKALYMHPRKFGFITNNTAPDYPSASDSDKEYGFVCNSVGLMADNSEGYYIW